MAEIIHPGPGRLFIMGLDEAQDCDTEWFDRVITVCQDSIRDDIADGQSYSFYYMSDGLNTVYSGSCSYTMFDAAATELYEALQAGERVLIHCHVGKSRSVAVATAALGRLLKLPTDEALDLIHEYRHIDNEDPSRLLIDHADTYIVNYTTSDVQKPLC